MSFKDFGKINYINPTTVMGMALRLHFPRLKTLALCDAQWHFRYPTLPRGIRGLSEQVLDTHELTVEAIITTDRALLRRALLTDPLTPAFPMPTA